ncbi:MAG: hypothetical protein DMF58_15795, partial [Acidobacteria bacterium]
MNALRAVAINSPPSGAGSACAVASAPPSVDRAASLAPAIALRYTAVPMLPRMAMPSAPPSSELVSEMAAAAPAFCGGATARIMSFASVKAGASPSEKIVGAVTIMKSGEA